MVLLVLRDPGDNGISLEKRTFIDDALRYVKDNYMNELKLSDIAKVLSVSAEHLCREFKKATGFGFCEYLTMLRLQNAEFMLKNEPGKSVSAVAYACGFNDSNYFSYKFKKTYGVTPRFVKKRKND